MGRKVIIKFRWESWLSAASRNHLTTFCRPFVHHACLRSCSAIVHFIQNNQGERKGGGLELTPFDRFILQKRYYPRKGG